MRIGITREASAYRVTLDDLRFLELCNEVHGSGRGQIAQERAYRLELRAQREKTPRRVSKKEPPADREGSACAVASKQDTTLITTDAGGCPPTSPARFVFSKRQANRPTCEGLNLSSPREFNSNKPALRGNREIGVSRETGDSALNRRQLLQRQAEEIKVKYGV